MQKSALKGAVPSLSLVGGHKEHENFCHIEKLLPKPLPRQTAFGAASGVTGVKRCSS